MIKVWLKENDIPSLTSFMGNIDSDSLLPFIEMAQTQDVKAIIGVSLYDKLNTDYLANTLTGVYAEIFNNYLQKMVVYFAASHYIAFNSSKIGNNGIIKTEGTTDLKEIDRLSARYKALANNVLVTFQDYIRLNPVPEQLNGCVEKRKTNILNFY